MTEKEYKQWWDRATAKQKKFVNIYLKTLSRKQALIGAGYKFKQTDFGTWKIFHQLLPVINYKLKGVNVSKDYLVTKWLEIAETDNGQAKRDALKELGKLYGMYEPEQSVTVNNNIPRTPVKIVFDREKSK